MRVALLLYSDGIRRHRTDKQDSWLTGTVSANFEMRPTADFSEARQLAAVA